MAAWITEMSQPAMPAAPQPRRQAARSRDWEQASTTSDDALLAGARARWANLPPARQMDLARCLAQCRRGEFARAVRSVVSVTAGLRRRNAADGTEQLHNAPCLVFVVRRKLSAAQLARQPSQRLPQDLLTPAWIDGREQVVAVPTDVQVQSRLLQARAQAAALAGVRADSLDGRSALGAVTWPVTVGGKRYALAPIHVLSPRPDLDGSGLRAGAQVAARTAQGTATGQAVVRATAFGGRVLPGQAPSLDAQLAELLSPTSLAALFGGLRLSAARPWVRSELELDALLADGWALEIHAPANNGRRPQPGMLPLQAERSLVLQDLLLGYDFADGSRRDITHAVLELQVRFDDRTFPGDSGCPVLLRDAEDRCTLAGMHIAGDASRGTSYVVPAWHLMDPGRYADVGGNLPAGPIKPLLQP